MLIALALGFVCAQTPPDAGVTDDQRPRLLVSDIAAQTVTPAEAASFTDAVVNSLASRKLFEVISMRDVQAFISTERQKQLLGSCADDDATCTKDLGELMRVRFVLTGQLSRIGTAYQLTLQLLDTARSKPVGRSTRLAGNLEELRQLVPYAAAEATGSPLPPPPSRALSITLLSAGGVALLAGGVFAITTFTRQQTLNDELCPGGVPTDGRCLGTSLRARSFYLEQDQALINQKWLAGGLAVGGAVLIALGILFMPPADGRVKVALAPSVGGFSVVGGF